jgi:hypothetical protein
MRHVFVAVFLICCFSQIKAQGNLQFNQVKLVTNQETVPVGKVWKVESVIYYIPEDQSGAQSSASTSCGSATFRSTSLVIDGVATKVGNGTQTAAYSNLNYTHSYTMLPIWLPSGSTLSGGPCLNKVSVIEFNIIP